MVLDRPHRVAGDRGAGHDRPTGLGGEPDRRVEAGVERRAPDPAGPLPDRRGRLAGDVAHPQPATDAQLREAEIRHQRGDHLEGQGEELGLEDLRADVGVDADQADGTRRGPQAARRPSSAAPEARPKPNLESSWPVRTYSWVWASTPGVTRMRTSGRAARPGGQAVEAVELVERVDHDAAHPDLDGPGQLGLGLVVAVQHQALAGHAGGQRDVQLAAGRHVDGHALLGGQPGHGGAEERLGRVGHPVTPRGDRLPAPAPQVVLVVDEHGRAEPLAEVLDVDAADRQAPPAPKAAPSGSRDGSTGASGSLRLLRARRRDRALRTAGDPPGRGHESRSASRAATSSSSSRGSNGLVM